MMKRILGIVLFCSAIASANAQKCGTDVHYQEAVKSDPSIEKAKAEFFERAAQYSKTPSNRAAIYTIPVVFHVFHTNGVENISKEQILDQMRILNADYSFTNKNKNKIRSVFTNVAADCQIKFELASIDPNGNCTDGINRIYSTLGASVNRTSEDVKQTVQWNYQKYLNIWVVTSIETDGNGTTLGYAFFPWMTPKSRDGIVIRHDRVGSIGTALSTADSGRTLTHEVGHWLGLLHTFQGECADEDNCDDTPPVGGTFTNASCPANGNSCNTDKPDLIDQWENYMDYSDGKCMAMFTLDQKSIMHSSLTTFPRSSNVSASNLLATGVTLASGAPLANFTASQRVVCAGRPVTFYDISCKSAVTARSWTLTGSSTPSSTQKNPVVVYQTPGKYKVTLLVQNGSGSNSKSVDQYIEVLSSQNGINPNFEEGFENNDLSSRGFISVSPKAWEVTSAAALTGTKSLKAPVSSNDALGTNYSFVLPPVNLSLLKNAVPGPKFTFRAAYAPAVDPATTQTEILRVYVSTDCGNTFSQIMERSGTGLAYNSAPITNNFVPNSASMWKLLGVSSLTSLGLDTVKNAIFRIDVLSAQGNPVYIDNINISSYNSGVEDLETAFADVELYPNPGTDVSNLELSTFEGQNIEIALYDMAGRMVSSIYKGYKNAGSETYTIKAPSSNAGTLYFVKIASERGQITKPITFAP
ncbi:MAG: PKD domain-containing protein [Bacteroidia bacterium]|nr:PKD domain-containing protein [Bacteroidia bacterium]